MVIPAGRDSEFEKAAFPDGLPKDRSVRIVPGGARRQDSVANGLKAVNDEIEYVAIHDAANQLAGSAVSDLDDRTIITAAQCILAQVKP